MKNRFLTLLAFIVMLSLVLAFAACNHTPPDDGSSDTGDTGDTGDTSGDGTPSEDEDVPKKLDTLAGKNAKQLYDGIAQYIASLQNFTASGGETVTVCSPDGSEREEVLSVTMKYATNTFDIYGCETVDGEEIFEMRVIYDNIAVYVDMGEDMRFKMKMSY